jgi:Derlin-2/3
MDGRVSLLDWYWEMPVVTRVYFTACSVATVACALDVITPFHLYYNHHAIWQGGQFWRLVTNFLFFGSWGVDFLFHMYFLIRYCRSLEEGRAFRGKPLDFLFCLLFGMTLLMLAAPHTSMMFFGSSLTFMLVYLWGKRNPEMQISLLGLVGFSAPYLPFVLLGFSLLLGHDVTADGLGIAIGHLYYFCEDVWPALAAARGWWVTRLLPSPSALLGLGRALRRSLEAWTWWGAGAGGGAGGGAARGGGIADFDVVQGPALGAPPPGAGMGAGMGAAPGPQQQPGGHQHEE